MVTQISLERIELIRAEVIKGVGFVYGVGAVGQRPPPNYKTTKVTPAPEMVRVTPL